MVVSSPGQRSTIERREGGAPLEELVASLVVGDAYDLVVAEGFKGSAVPKIWIFSDTPPPWP